MKKNLFLATVLLLSFQTFYSQTFTLKSTDLGGQSTKKQEFNGFGCEGENASPQLSWANAPKETKSFAITMYDPDAPTGSGFWHWIVFNIPSHINELVTNAGNTSLSLMPKEAIQSITDYGMKGFGGPCPPKGHGIHQYIITIYALKTDKLPLDANTNPAIVGFYLWQNTIEKASLITYYRRN